MPRSATGGYQVLKKKRLLRWLLAIVGGVILLLLAGIFCLDPILKGVTERRLRRQTGLEASIGELTLSLRSASLCIRDLKLYNPKEFGGSVLVDIAEFSFTLDAPAVRSGKLHFRQIHFHLREIHVVRNQQGRVNLQALEAAPADTNIATAQSQVDNRRFQFAGIDKLYLTLGKVRYSDLQDPENNEELTLQVHNELVQNLQTEEEFKQWSGAFGVRILLQVISQQMRNSPERSQSFGEMLKRIKKSLALGS